MERCREQKNIFREICKGKSIWSPRSWKLVFLFCHRFWHQGKFLLVFNSQIQRNIKFIYIFFKRWRGQFYDIITHRVFLKQFNMFFLKLALKSRNFHISQVPNISFFNITLLFILLCAGDFYDDVKNRKAYFEIFAKRKGFDVLIAENWYSISQYSKVHHNVFNE